MFDWNDEELENIIWDGDGETDDHIVPYPEGNEEKPPGLYGDHIKKDWIQETANAKPSEQRKPIADGDSDGSKQESSLQYDTTNGISAAVYSMDSWPNSSLSPAAKTDQNSMANEVSKDLTEGGKLDSLREGEATQLDSDSNIFQNQQEDRGQIDFVDYGWANIGSFDDLDRIFSNDDSIFGNVSLGNSDQIWSSSKDATSTQEKSFPLAMNSPILGLGALQNTSGYSEVKTEYVQDQDQSYTHGYGKMNYSTSHAQQNANMFTDQTDYDGGKRKLVATEKTELEKPEKTSAFNSHLAAENITNLNEFTGKVNNQGRISKTQKKSGRGCEGQQLQDSYGTWSPRGIQFQQVGQISPSMPQTCTPSALSQRTQLHGPVSSHYQHSSNPFVSPGVYGSINDEYSTMISLGHTHSREENQLMLSGFKASPSKPNPLSRSPSTSRKPLTMTPQEKIEKLRRRQQMQALLAIQRQQQQFSHQVSSSDHSVAQTCLNENPIQLMQGGNIEVEENVSNLPFIDPNSPVEQDDSNTISVAVDDYYSVEEAILRQLEEIIAKLDIPIRLCIRDSLFRLAQSAMQRHSASDTSSANKSSRDLEVLRKEETSSHIRIPQMPGMETETNHIDRTVAHLLFYRPLEAHPETPESPAMTKLPSERTTASSLSSPRGLVPDSFKSNQSPSCHGSKNPLLSAEGAQSNNSHHIETSENASNNEAADAGGVGNGDRSISVNE